MAICRHPAWAARCCAALLAALSPALSAAPPAAHASTPAAWEELRLRAIQTCTAELLSRNVNVLAVEPIDSSGATYEPTAEGVRLSLRVQKPGQAPRRVDCSFRRPLFNPPLLR